MPKKVERGGNLDALLAVAALTGAAIATKQSRKKKGGGEVEAHDISNFATLETANASLTGGKPRKSGKPSKKKGGEGEDMMNLQLATQEGGKKKGTGRGKGKGKTHGGEGVAALNNMLGALAAPAAPATPAAPAQPAHFTVPANQLMGPSLVGGKKNGTGKGTGKGRKHRGGEGMLDNSMQAMSALGATPPNLHSAMQPPAQFTTPMAHSALPVGAPLVGGKNGKGNKGRGKGKRGGGDEDIELFCTGRGYNKEALEQPELDKTDEKIVEGQGEGTLGGKKRKPRATTARRGMKKGGAEALQSLLRDLQNALEKSS